jgi:glycosyltransferase involved in cell wall biosynthesis
VERDESSVRLLHKQVKELVLDNVFDFESQAPMASLASWSRRCLVHVNLTPMGFGHNVALEAMACERPGLVANDGFRETLDPYAAPLLFGSGEPASLAEQLLSMLARVEPERVAIETYLRNPVVQMYSLRHLTVGAFAPLRKDAQQGLGSMDKCDPIIIIGM